MQSAGIVRYIDDLGRIVLPKELRRTAGIIEGDPLEILPQTDGTIILRKYTPNIPDLKQEVFRLQQYIKESNYSEPDQSRWVRSLEKVRREIQFAEHAKHAMQDNQEHAVTEV